MVFWLPCKVVEGGEGGGSKEPAELERCRAALPAGELASPLELERGALGSGTGPGSACVSWVCNPGEGKAARRGGGGWERELALARLLLCQPVRALLSSGGMDCTAAASFVFPPAALKGLA